MNQSQLSEILADHKKWLNGSSGKRADLSRQDWRGLDLSEANLTGANLRWADLIGANLTGANLRWADLIGANLTGANLTGANLSVANLAEANLTGANLTEVNLTEANLARSDLTWANLTGANLRWANLTGAYLARANLAEANLTGANLRWGYLYGADLTDAIYDLHQIIQIHFDDPDLITEAMRHDAANHPDPSTFDRWANGGPCPYENKKARRLICGFEPKKALWKRGKPTTTPHEFFEKIAKNLKLKCKS